MKAETQTKYEATILVRVDNMTNPSTIGQRTVRVEIDPRDEDLDALMQTALEQAPPIDEWPEWSRV